MREFKIHHYEVRGDLIYLYYLAKGNTEGLKVLATKNCVIKNDTRTEGTDWVIYITKIEHKISNRVFLKQDLQLISEQTKQKIGL
mgnify:CR=1 FL=1